MIKIALALLIYTNAHALERKSAEYIISGKAITETLIKSTLKAHQPDQIRPLSKGHYLVKYKKDPGLKTLQKSADKVFQISPNQSYKAFTKPD